ncbi:DUF924 family protein [Rhodovulum sp. DZ06]|uniref:DUF924 family protein n=1 Tax=Rhodovulum sp. DZ06 TaxID=3425126 RepID=UPI003D3498AD
MHTTPEAVLDYWLNEVGPSRWFAVDETLDAEIRARFMPAWRQARAGALDSWSVDPAGALALLILVDQFPRNMFRGDPRSFECDARARRLAKLSIALGHDLATEEEARIFFYLPLSHSENLFDQDRAVRLVAARMPGHVDTLVHARAHRAVIRRFGRFPFRNAALSRETAAEEAAWLEAGGYGAEVQALS